MIKTYSYLEKYKLKSEFESQKYDNQFYPVNQNEIDKAEHDLGYKFPSQLIDFYKEIGYGFLVKSQRHQKNYCFPGTNRINHPDMIVDMLLYHIESGLMSEDTYELLEPGDLPFFEIGDSSQFLFMKLNSSNPNAVWTIGGIKIEDSFERFIWRLYYEDPGYYGDIIEEYYRKVP